MAKSKAAARPLLKGPAIRLGKKPRWASAACWAVLRCAMARGPDQVLDRVVAQEGGEQRRDRRQVRRLVRHLRGHAVGQQAGGHVVGEGAGQADDHQREEDADGDHLGRVLEGGVHARPGPAVLGRQRVHDAGAVGRAERRHGEAGEEQDHGEDRVGEVDREGLEQREADGRADHAAGGEGARSVAVREHARQRPGDEHAAPSAGSGRCRPTAGWR